MLCVTHLHYAGFAGADYDLQDALVESTNKSSSRAERHGQSFYDYELAGPVRPPENASAQSAASHMTCLTSSALPGI